MREPVSAPHRSEGEGSGVATKQGSFATPLEGGALAPTSESESLDSPSVPSTRRMPWRGRNAVFGTFPREEKYSLSCSDGAERNAPPTLRGTEKEPPFTQRFLFYLHTFSLCKGSEAAPRGALFDRRGKRKIAKRVSRGSKTLRVRVQREQSSLWQGRGAEPPRLPPPYIGYVSRK